MYMRDEIDEEVKKLLEDMERKCDMSAALNDAEDSVAQAFAMSANYMKGLVKEFAMLFAH